jgi:hypothetical protein
VKLVDLVGASTLVALAGTLAVLHLMREGDVSGRRAALVVATLVVDLTLSLAGIGLTWAPVFEVAAPLSLGCAVVAVFVAAERPNGRRAREARWKRFEAQFREHVAGARPDRRPE